MEEVKEVHKDIKCTLYHKAIFWTQIISKVQDIFSMVKPKWLTKLLEETLQSKLDLPFNKSSPITHEGYVVLELHKGVTIADVRPPHEEYSFFCVEKPPKEDPNTTTTLPNTTWTSTVDISLLDLSTTELSSLEPSSTKISTIQPSSTKISIQPSSMEISSIQPSSTEILSIQPSSTEISSIQPSTTEISSLETIDLSTENSTMEEWTTGSPTGNSSLEELTSDNSTTLEPIRRMYCKGKNTFLEGFLIDWPDTELGEVAKADCPKGSYGDAFWMCSNKTGKFVGKPEHNCTVLNCSEPSSVPSKEVLVYMAERLALCGSDGNDSLKTLDLLDLMRKEKDVYRKGISQEKDDSRMRRDVTTFVRVFDRLLEKDAVVWTRMIGDRRIRTSMEIMKETEETAWLMGCIEENMTLKRNNLAIEVFDLGKEAKTLELSLNSLSVGEVELPSNLIAETAKLCHKHVQRGVVAAYRNVEDYLTPDPMSVVGTGILGVSLGGQWNTTYNLPEDKKIQIRLNHLQMQFGFAEPVCVFLDWNYDQKKGKYGVWETEGCVVTETTPFYTVCECTHLTNFAVLMNFAGPEPEGKNKKILSLLSLVFSCLSVLALVITILIYATVKSFHNRRNTITCNLAVCLLAMNILVQSGLERVETTVCKIVSGILQYTVLAAFIWMMLEGVLLYRMVILVFEVKTMRLPLLYVIAYGVPALIVAMSSAVRPGAIIRQNYCWPSQENGLIWSITGPILLIITVNLIIFGMTLNAASKIKRLVNGPTDDRKKNLVQRLKGSISLMWLLGFSWAVGFFYVPNTDIAAYFFVILNGLQGVFLFLTQMIFNNPVRKKLFSIYKENMTKITSPSGTWQFLLGKSPKDSSSVQETSGIGSDSGNVRPSAPPQPDMYTIQVRHFERDSKQQEPCHPFTITTKDVADIRLCVHNSMTSA